MRWPRGASGGSPSHDRRPFTSASDVRHAQAVSRCRGGEHLAGAAEPPLRRGGACRPVERARADPLSASPGRAGGQAIRHLEVPYDEGQPAPEVVPRKLKLSQASVRQRSLGLDHRLMARAVAAILGWDATRQQPSGTVTPTSTGTARATATAPGTATAMAQRTAMATAPRTA